MAVPTTRTPLVAAYKAMKAAGQTPTVDGLIRAVPAAKANVAETTLRIIRLCEVSGARSVSGLRRWQEERRQGGAAEGDELLVGFNTEAAHEIIQGWLTADSEPVQPERADDESEDGETGKGERQGRAQESSGGGLSLTGQMEFVQRWHEQARIERTEAAREAREQERAIAAAQAETIRAQEATKRASMRTFAVIAVVVAMIAGIAIGIAYASRSTSIAPSMPHTEGVQSPVLPPTVTPPTAIPTPTPPSVVPAPPVAVPAVVDPPKDAVKPAESVDPKP